MNNDLEFTLSNKIFEEVVAAKNLRVLIHNRSKSATLSISPSATKAQVTRSNPYQWPQKRSWRGEFFV